MAAEPYIGQIQAFGFTFTPEYYVPCMGQLLSINQYTALFALIGCIYGGDCRASMGIPDLRGVVPIGKGISPVTHNEYNLGAMIGLPTRMLTQDYMPTHKHTISTQGTFLNASSKPGTSPEPMTGGVPAAANDPIATFTNNAYNNEVPDVELAIAGSQSARVSITGSGISFSVMQPFQVVNFCMATEGIFPPRS